jgi:molybdopterin-guanine dinucleotide biosynthesis protein A
MGKDKGLLPFLGVPLINRLIDRFSDFAPEILIISNNPVLAQEVDLPVGKDVIPGRGALGGLLTALTLPSTPLVGLIGVDLPFASPGLIREMADRLGDSSWDCVIPSTEFGLEPLHAVYRREVCLTYVQEAINQDLWKMNSWHGNAKLKILDPGETRKITGSDVTFLNLNTPEEFSAAEDLARTLGID